MFVGKIALRLRVAFLTMFFALTGCMIQVGYDVTGVTLDQATLSVAFGATAVLTPTISPATATDRSVTWASDHPEIAPVDGAGTVTGQAPGTAIVTVTTVDGTFTATCTVTVTGTLTLNKTSSTIVLGSTDQLSATTNPPNLAQVWTTSDVAVATVSATGLVTAGRVGTATITVTSTDGIPPGSCEVTVATLYSGYYFNGTSNRPCYWIGDSMTSLDVETGSNGYALSPAVYSGGKVYTSGSYFSATTVSCYWEGATLHDLPSGRLYAYAFDLALSDGIVYTAGEYYHGEPDNRFEACYWEGTVLHMLDDATAGIASAIAIDGGTVYMAGSYDSDPSAATVMKPCYWIGTTRYPLDVGSYTGQAYAISVVSGTVYTAGFYYTGPKEISCYWVGTTRYDLDDTTTTSRVYDMTVSGGTVYSSGQVNNAPCYWEGTTRHNLAGEGTNAANAYTIAVHGGAVYVGGSFYSSVNTRWEPCYWEGTTLHSLRGALTRNAEVTGPAWNLP